MPKKIRHWIRLVWKKCPVSIMYLCNNTYKVVKTISLLFDNADSTGYVSMTSCEFPNEVQSHCSQILLCTRPMEQGGRGGFFALQEYGRSVNPIPTRGGRLCLPSFVPPNFYTFRRLVSYIF